MLKVKIENKSSVAIHGLKPGQTRNIDVDVNGTPLDRDWRRRLRDSQIDGAIVVVADEPAPKIQTKMLMED